jgi:hypothetical protein
MYPPPLSPEEETALMMGTREITPTNPHPSELMAGEHYVAPVQDMEQILYQMQYGLENRQIPMQGLFGGGDRHYPPAQ